MKANPKICPNCFAQMEGSGICPRCNFDCTTYIVLPHHLIPGTLIKHRYKIGRVLGEGGFGITYVGQDIVLDLKVAIKEFFMTGYVTRSHDISPNVFASLSSHQSLFTQHKEKFLNEARILARFNDEPGIVGVRDFCEENGTAYIVMDYLDGTTLKSYLELHNRLTPSEAVSLLIPMMHSLQRVHANGLIHRDISPDNIMLLEKNRIKLLDFGAARDISQTAIEGMSVILKRGYAPEEQYRRNGHQGPWTDVYSLAATLYRCIVGNPPVDAMERLYQDLLPPPADIISCPDSISKVIMKGLAVHQSNRYQDVGSFLTDLEAAVQAQGNVNYNVSQDDHTIHVRPHSTLENDKTKAPTYHMRTVSHKNRNSKRKIFSQAASRKFVRTTYQKEEDNRVPHGKRSHHFLIAAAAAALAIFVIVFPGGLSSKKATSAPRSAESGAEIETCPDLPTIIINDVAAELPGSIQPLLDAGWAFKNIEDEGLTLRPKEDVSVTLLNEYGSFEVNLVNQTLNTLPISNCTLYMIRFLRSAFNDNNLGVTGNTCYLSNGLFLNDSPLAEVLTVCPEFNQEDNTFTLETENSFQQYRLDDNGLLQSIYLRVDSDVLSKTADTTTFSTERPSEYDDPSFLSAYTLPDFILQTSELSAALPLTVEDLIHLGWKVERQPEYIPADSHAYIYLRYDIRTTLTVSAANYTGNAIAPQYGILRSLSLTTGELGNDGYSIALPDLELLYNGKPWLLLGKTTRPEIIKSALTLDLHCELTKTSGLKLIPYKDDGRAITLGFDQNDVLTFVNIYGTSAALSQYNYEQENNK